MTEVNTPPDDDSSEIYDLDLDDDGLEDRDSVMREAVERVERLSESAAHQALSLEEADSLSSGGADSSAAGGSDTSALELEMAELREQSLRTLADYENYRKRTEREKGEIRRYGTAETLREFLDVIDNLERALSASGSDDDLKVGVELIHRQMLDLVRRQGVEVVPALGEVFDPALHDAVVCEEDADIAEPQIIEELQRGYLLHDRLLRPARVRVAMPPASLQSTGMHRALGLDDAASLSKGEGEAESEEESESDGEDGNEGGILAG